ncbi:hypothetical protein Tco_0664704 [Tanacetum coccineum]
MSMSIQKSQVQDGKRPQDDDLRLLLADDLKETQDHTQVELRNKLKIKDRRSLHQTTCHSKDGGPSKGLYLCRIVLSCDSGSDLSFNKSASLEHLFSLARVSLAEASKPDLSFRWKHWKSGFFFIHRWAIPDVMVWRHPDAAIDDLRPAAGSFNMVDVRRLSVHVIKLRDMPKGVLVLSGLSHVWKSRVCGPVLRGADRNVMGIHDFLCLPEWTGAEVQDEPHLDVRSTLQRLPFYCTPPAAANAVILDPTPEDLAVGTLSSKIVAKAKAS